MQAEKRKRTIHKLMVFQKKNFFRFSFPPLFLKATYKFGKSCWNGSAR